MIFYIFILYFLAFPLSLNSWSYRNLEKWQKACHKGKRQSPINLVEEKSSHEVFLPFSFKNYNMEYTARLEHVYNTVRVRVIPETKVPTFSGGNYRGEYVLKHFHFHWQSEHTFNGKRYPMEVHFVHYKAKYANFSEALEDPEGIGILAVLLKRSPEPNKKLEPVTEVLKMIASKPGEIMELKRKINPHILLPSNTAGYYTYPGSLTTPNCSEIVIWTVFTDKLHVSDSQVKLFKTIDTGQGLLIRNYRPIQMIHKRKVVFTRSHFNSAPSTIYVTPILSLVHYTLLHI